jgi:hypothetical protein
VAFLLLCAKLFLLIIKNREVIDMDVSSAAKSTLINGADALIVDEAPSGGITVDATSSEGLILDEPAAAGSASDNLIISDTLPDWVTMDQLRHGTPIPVITDTVTWRELQTSPHKLSGVNISEMAETTSSIEEKIESYDQETKNFIIKYRHLIRDPLPAFLSSDFEQWEVSGINRVYHGVGDGHNKHKLKIGAHTESGRWEGELYSRELLVNLAYYYGDKISGIARLDGQDEKSVLKFLSRIIRDEITGDLHQYSVGEYAARVVCKDAGSGICPDIWEKIVSNLALGFIVSSNAAEEKTEQGVTVVQTNGHDIAQGLADEDAYTAQQASSQEEIIIIGEV